jgi:L-rhamnose isomerase
VLGSKDFVYYYKYGFYGEKRASTRKQDMKHYQKNIECGRKKKKKKKKKIVQVQVRPPKEKLHKHT